MAFKIANNSEYETLYNAYKNAGGAVELKDGLGGQVSSGGGGGFEEGDVIEWPDTIQALGIKLREGSKPAQAFIVKVTNNGVERYQLFFPSTLGKSIRELEVDAEGKVLSDKGFTRTLGNAATEYQSHANLEIKNVIEKMMTNHPDGMKVTKVDTINTYKYQSRETTTAKRYTIDFV